MCSSAVPLVCVCAAGVGCVGSRRTARRALATVLRDDMLFFLPFLPGLDRIAFSQCVLIPQLCASQDGHRHGV